VQLIDVDVLGIELAQRIVERGDGAFGARIRVADIERRLGGDDDLLARNRLERLAEYGLGAVGGGGVEEIDAEIERLMDQRYRLGLAPAAAEAEPTEAPAAEPGDTRPQTGPSEHDVFHLMHWITGFETLPGLGRERP
jgi:hypothetical protein